MTRLSTALLLIALAPVVVSAQFQPQTAHVWLYFPQLADGGTQVQKWQTTFTFINANPSSTAYVRLDLFDNNGKPLVLDFGAGLLSSHLFSIPPLGSRTLRSKVASQVIVTGWAIAASSVPIVGTVSFREIDYGVARQQISAPPTLPTLVYMSPATPSLGVAIANTYSDASISVNLSLTDSEGRALGNTAKVTLPPFGHASFNLSDKFAVGSFSGILKIAAANPPGDDFVAWTLGEDGGLLASLPPGQLGWPISHWERIWLIYRQVTDAAMRLGLITTLPTLKIEYSADVNAYARNGTTVGVYIGLSQLISDSPSELAYVVGHEVAHIHQQRTGDVTLDNREFDADLWGVLIAMNAGYDPYAIAGALAKLSMATGSAGLASQFEDELSADAHKSFNSRLDGVYTLLSAACNYDSTMKAACDYYKGIVHPNLPPRAPLSSGGRTERSLPSN
jgi:Zn-dependent protease with chaperone function